MEIQTTELNSLCIILKILLFFSIISQKGSKNAPKVNTKGLAETTACTRELYGNDQQIHLASRSSPKPGTVKIIQE